MKTAPWFAHNGVQEADARFIVRACNHHDELVEALRGAADLIEGDKVGVEWKQGCHEFLQSARAILAKLEADK